MRRVILALLAPSALALAALAPTGALAQVGMPGHQGASGQQGQQQQQQAPRPRGPARLSGQVNAGPCPYVKILYDAARYVELSGDRVTASAVGYTGEIEGLTANCRYREDDPITVDINILFQLGRGPQATEDVRTYRYWIAVTERNSAILAKEYFEFQADFAGSDRTSVQEEIRSLTIPRASQTTSGGSFEILVGFDVTPEMAEFNRSGSRFRINAGQVPAGTPTEQ